MTTRKRPRRQSRHRLRYPLSRIKAARTFGAHEIGRLLDVHPKTVGQWIKAGLQPIDGRRPVLILGSELKSFLARRRQGNRRKCAFDQFYCFRCREPRQAWGGMADLSIRSTKTGRLESICAVCETPVSRAIRLDDVSRLEAAMEIQHKAKATSDAGAPNLAPTFDEPTTGSTDTKGLSRSQSKPSFQSEHFDGQEQGQAGRDTEGRQSTSRIHGRP